MLFHGLRGSASPVLTATGFVNGRWQFSTPDRIHTPWPITKKFGTGDYVGGPYGCAKFGANLSTGGFWANGWNITKFFLFIYTFFSSTHLQVRRDDGFSRLMAQTTRTRARMCLLGVSLTLLPIGGEIPRKPQFLGREQAFSSRTGKILNDSCYRNYCIDFNQILQNDRNHQEVVVGGPNPVSYTHLTLPTIYSV